MKNRRRINLVFSFLVSRFPSVEQAIITNISEANAFSRKGGNISRRSHGNIHGTTSAGARITDRET